MFRLENLSFTSPPCLHSDWFASSFAQAFGSPLVVSHFLLLRFSLPSSDSRGPTLISDFNVSSRFWAARLVSSAITAGSPCGCSAAYSPSAYLTLPKQIFFIFHFPSPVHSFQAPLDVTLFDWTRWLRALFGRNPVRREPSLIDSLHQVIASNPLLSLGVKGRVPFLSCPKTLFIIIGERLSLYFIWQGRRIPLYQ